MLRQKQIRKLLREKTEGERARGGVRERKESVTKECYKDIIMNGYERGVSEHRERPGELWER